MSGGQESRSLVVTIYNPSQRHSRITIYPFSPTLLNHIRYLNPKCSVIRPTTNPNHIITTVQHLPRPLRPSHLPKIPPHHQAGSLCPTNYPNSNHPLPFQILALPHPNTQTHALLTTAPNPRKTSSACLRRKSISRSNLSLRPSSHRTLLDLLRPLPAPAR